MTCAQRIARIRLMEKLERSNDTVKTEDGTIKYLDSNNNVIIEAKTIQKGEA